MRSRVMKHVMMMAAGAALLTIGIAHAATKADAEAAIATAKADMKTAAHMNNQWTPTVSTFKKAEKAMADGKYDAAEALAKKARGLAAASVEQAREQKHLWQKAVPR